MKETSVGRYPLSIVGFVVDAILTLSRSLSRFTKSGVGFAIVGYVLYNGFFPFFLLHSLQDMNTLVSYLKRIFASRQYFLSTYLKSCCF